MCLHIHHQQHVKGNPPYTLLSPPPPSLSSWQALKHCVYKTRMREATWTQTETGRENTQKCKPKERKRERETGSWEVSSHHTPACLLLSNSLQWSLSTATVCPSCPREHKTTRLLLVLFVTSCRQIAVHKVVTTTERKIHYFTCRMVHLHTVIVSPFSHRFLEHLWKGGQIIALTLGHSAPLHMGSKPDTSWLLLVGL